MLPGCIFHQLSVGSNIHEFREQKHIHLLEIFFTNFFPQTLCSLVSQAVQIEKEEDLEAFPLT